MNRTENESRAIIEFYRGGATDDRGRHLAEILAWPDEFLERHHDFIQWLFPLRERSGANPGAPILHDAAIRAFRADPVLQSALRKSLARMLAFYGLGMGDAAPVEVVPADNFVVRSRNWLTAGNHNHLRLTRIITSLRLLGLETEAQALYVRLTAINSAESAKPIPGITPTTFRYWSSAANARIDLLPD